MDGSIARTGVLAAGLYAMSLMLAAGTVHAQGRPPAAPANAKAAAPFDLTGHWVSLVTRDWRFRMVVPGRGEYSGVPLNLAGKQFADAWSPTADEAAGKQCGAYGAGSVMLIPGRLHVTWQDEETLKVETDAGMQTRLLHFKPEAAAQVQASYQGYSAASWMIHDVHTVIAMPQPDRWGQLKITTDRMLGGLLRKNGLPYSDQSTQTEYWEMHKGPGGEYLIVSAILHDPMYLDADYYTTATFRKESDGSRWRPTPCSLTSAP